MPKQQTEIPGTERPSIDAIDDAACDFVAKRDERMALSKEEKAAKGHLLAQMKAHENDLDRDKDGSLVYSFYDGERELEARYRQSLDVSVRVRKAEEDDGEADNVVDIEEASKKIG
jgi:hypothetical protein